MIHKLSYVMFVCGEMLINASFHPLCTALSLERSRPRGVPTATKGCFCWGLRSVRAAEQSRVGVYPGWSAGLFAEVADEHIAARLSTPGGFYRGRARHRARAADCPLSRCIPCLLYTSPSPRDGLLSR